MNILTKELQEGIASNPFRVGQIYTRKIVYSICNPGKIWDKGGNWSTGYATAGKKLIIFMNMDTPGRTGHDYNNSYDSENREIKWCGKTGTRPDTPLIMNLIEGFSVPHFFARWDRNDPNFTYIGIGLAESFQEDYVSNAGTAIRFTLRCLEQQKDLKN